MSFCDSLLNIFWSSLHISDLSDHRYALFSGLTVPHTDTADVLLSQEVPDLHQSSSLLDDDVDGEMGVHRAHFVPETLQADGGETGDEVKQ